MPEIFEAELFRSHQLIAATELIRSVVRPSDLQLWGRILVKVSGHPSSTIHWKSGALGVVGADQVCIYQVPTHLEPGTSSIALLLVTSITPYFYHRLWLVTKDKSRNLAKLANWRHENLAVIISSCLFLQCWHNICHWGPGSFSSFLVKDFLFITGLSGTSTIAVLYVVILIVHENCIRLWMFSATFYKTRKANVAEARSEPTFLEWNDL